MKNTVGLMNRKTAKAVALLTAIILAFVAFCGGRGTALADDTETTELPYGGEFGPSTISNKIKGVSAYSCSKLKVLTPEEAAEQNVPDGYKGHVVTMSPGGNLGVAFDFSEANISVHTLKSISIRVYVESTDGDITEGDSHYPEVRIVYPGATDHQVVKYDVSSRTDRWNTIVIYPDGTNITNDAKRMCGADNALMTLANEEGILQAFEVSVRRSAGTGNFYIDFISLNFMDDTHKGPDITYNGPEVMQIPKGSKIVVDAVADDFDEKRICPITYEWEKGVALDDDGFPAAGTKCKLILKSADGFGNITEKAINAEVMPPDKTPPRFNFETDTIKCVAGTVPQTVGAAEDDTILMSVSYEWPEDAIDRLGRINEGTFEVKAKAEDTSGNVTEKVIKVVAGGADTFEGFTVIYDKKG